MKTRIAMLLGLAAAWSGSALAAVNWIDWSTVNSGTLNTGSGTTSVTLTGSTPASLTNGDYYYNNANTGYTAASGTYGGLNPTDMLQVINSSSYTINFGGASILNPYLALVSIGQTGLPVTYTFTGPNGAAPVSVVSYGSNYWGYGSYTVNGNQFTGREYNGILQLAGSFTSLTVTTNPGENWHGFNIGVSTTAVPEPATMALMGLGLVGIGAIRRRKAVRA